MTARDVARVFAEVLGVAGFGPDDDLVSFGGNSLHAVRISQRLRARGFDVRVADVLDHPTPAGLAEHLRDGKVGTRPPDESRAVAGPASTWELPAAQRRIWVLHELDPDRLDHLVTLSFELRGPLRPDALMDAWREVLARHEVLRMRVEVRDGAPAGVVEEGEPPPMTFIDASRIPAPLRDPLTKERVDRMRSTPMALDAGLLTRASLVKRDETLHQLEIVVHHIACDGWSVSIVLEDLFSFYDALAGGGALPDDAARSGSSYADYAAWEREHDAPRWRAMGERAVARLTPLPPPLRFPGELEDDPGDPEPNDAAELAVPVPVDTRAVVERARTATGHSSLTLGLAALTSMLQGLTGRDEFLIAVPLANRPAPEFERVVGDFVNTGLVRLDAARDGGIQGLVAHVRSQVDSLLDDASLPIDRLVSLLRREGLDYARAPARVAFSIQNFAGVAAAPRDFEVEAIEVAERQSKFDLVFTVDDSPTCSRLIVTFRPSLFAHAAVEEWTASFLGDLRVVASALAGADLGSR